MPFLRLLESIRNPMLDVVMQYITYFGEELLFMVIALVLFWCVDKKQGYYILIVGFFGTMINQFLKLWYRIPRPWVLDPNFTIVESARAGATGYSFPSGHTQNVVGTFGGIARYTKKRWLRIACIVLAALVAFSRMYLGVHTPLDVGVSVLIAAVLIFAVYPLVDKMDQKPGVMYGILAAGLVVAVAYLLFVKFYRFPADIDQGNYSEGLKNGYSLLGALLGLLVSYIYDRKKLHFEVTAPLLGQLLKVGLGLAGILAVKEGLKMLFQLLFPGVLFWNLPRYFLTVAFAGCLWPMTFSRFRRIGGKAETKK